MLESNGSTQSTPDLDRVRKVETYERPLKRKFTNPSLCSTNSLFRASSFLSEVEDGDQARWSREHWKKLEEYYVRKDRDFEKAAAAFYYCESLIRMPDTDEKDPKMKELWSREKILWRCKCLDTRAKYQPKDSPNRKRHKSDTSESGSFSIPERKKLLQSDCES